MFVSLYRFLYSLKCQACGERFFWGDSFRLHLEGHVFVDVVLKLRTESAALRDVANQLRQMADTLERFP